MAAGPHPFPSRTRQLSPPAPMVLGGRPPGRVGRRRNKSLEGPAERRALRRFRPIGSLAVPPSQPPRRGSGKPPARGGKPAPRGAKPPAGKGGKPPARDAKPGARSTGRPERRDERSARGRPGELEASNRPKRVVNERTKSWGGVAKRGV